MTRESTATIEQVAEALGTSVTRAEVTVTALQAAFVLQGVWHTWDDTAKIAIDALNHSEGYDQDVHYAKRWLKTRRSQQG